MKNENVRTCYKKEDEDWVEIQMTDLIEGDIFTLVESDGSEVPGIWKATKPKIENGIHIIDAITVVR